MILHTRNCVDYPHHGEPAYVFTDYTRAYQAFQSAVAWKDTPCFPPEYMWFLVCYDVAENGELTGTELARK